MKKIIEELRVHEQAIQQELDSVNIQVASLTDQLSRIREAIAALDGKHRVSPKASSKTSTKKTPSEVEVESILRSLIGEHGRLPNDELYALLETQLVKAGKAKFGLRSKFAKVIAASSAWFKSENPDRPQSASIKSPCKAPPHVQRVEG